MSHLETFVDLLARVGASEGGVVLVGSDELATWPSNSVAALQSQRLLVQARSAESVICPGCEQACVMPVNTISISGREPRRFVACDKRSDVSRVPVTNEQLAQWRCDADAVVSWIVSELGVRRSSRRSERLGVVEVGMVAGRRRHQMVCLQFDDELSLIAGSSTLPLSECVRYSDDGYTLDLGIVRKLVDSSTTSDPRYTPRRARLEDRKLVTAERHKKWQQAYRELHEKSPNMSDVWYSRKIARTPVADGRKPETIRRYMK